MKSLYRFLFLIGFISAFENALCQQVIKIPEDYSTIQAGIDAAANGDTVLVADNIYFENISFKGKAITVASYFLLNGDTSHISNTIINGSNPTNPDSSSVVSFYSGEDTNSVLCGFTITGGSGTLSFGWKLGGGIICLFSGAKIINNYIVDNSISWQGENAMGGGICAVGPAYIIIRNNRIMNNLVHSNYSWGGGILLEWMSGCIINNLIHNNTAKGNNGTANGGGILSQSDSISTDFLSIENNSISYNKSVTSSSNQVAINGGIDIIFTKINFKDNYTAYNSAISDYAAYGGGMRIRGSFRESIITGNTFFSNSASSQGASYCGGLWIQFSNEKLRVEGNYFISNQAKNAGGVYLYISNPKLLRNFISSNVASQEGGGIYINNSSPIIQNNLIKNNQANNGGGISIRNSQPKMVNNTVIQNQAIAYGSAFYSVNSDIEVLNSVFWGNTASYPPQNFYLYGGSCNVEFSNVEGGYTGTGNININPNFLEDSLCCYNPASLCIDAGRPDTLFDPIDPNNPGYPLYPAMGTLRNDMGWHGGLGSGNIVPVELINFTAENLGADVFLSWSTATEINNRGFEIERRTEDGRYLTIGFVSGNGTTALQHDYSYKDKDLPAGIYWYRLKQLDFNGSSQYSDELKINTTGLLSYSLGQNYPNPFNPSTTIRYSLAKAGEVHLAVYDILGRKVYQLIYEEKPAGTYELNWNAANLPSGVYFYRLEAGDLNETKKMILMK